jgi:hypothetical protein
LKTGWNAQASFSTVCATVLLLLLRVAVPGAQAHSPASRPDLIVVDFTIPAHPFWEHGSERANVTLRESYRSDLRSVKQITDFKYVRFHAIFHDEMGVYDEDAQGKGGINFSYVDQVYDGLLAHGVRPFIELSLVPRKLAAKDSLHPFWYKPNVSPPKDWEKWDESRGSRSRDRKMYRHSIPSGSCSRSKLHNQHIPLPHGIPSALSLEAYSIWQNRLM